MSGKNGQIILGRETLNKEIHIEAVTSLYYFEFSDRFEDTPEAHSAWELVYVDKGECTAVADGKDIFLSQGEMYIHKPFEEHLVRMHKNVFSNVIIITFECSSSVLDGIAGKRIKLSAEPKKELTKIIHEASETFDISNSRLKIDGVMLKNGSKLFAGEQSIVLRLELMLIELIRENGLFSDRKKLFVKKEIAEDEFCVRIIEFFEENIYGKLDITELCERMNFSRSYISKHFSEKCGHSLTKYFNMMKIEEAKRLIRETNMSFFDISERLMLSNSHYFSTLFKGFVGMTPTQYKKSCK